MTQQRLNHRIHQEKMDALDLNSIAKEFAQANVSSFFWTIHLSFSVYYLNISVAVQKRTITVFP